MLPEAADCIKIADKYLPFESAERRLALAKDIAEAIMRHAERIAHDAIKTADERMR